MYRNLTAIVEQDGRIRLRGPCVVTGLEHSVVVSWVGALAYFQGGANAQEAFTELPKEEREFLISGTSPDGWQTLFGDAEASDEENDSV